MSRGMRGIVIQPATADRLADFESLFGKRGACGGCWCMWWRLRRSQFEKQKGAGNRRAMKRIVNAGGVPGLLAYQNGAPIGWCSVAPRNDFDVLARSRVLAPVDQQPVWSIVCFFVARPYRRQGITVKLLRAAIQYAGQHGARIVEGYPVVPKKGRMLDVFAYTGLVSAFEKAGFREVARRSETRPIMRRVVRGARPPVTA